MRSANKMSRLKFKNRTRVKHWNIYVSLSEMILDLPSLQRFFRFLVVYTLRASVKFNIWRLVLQRPVNIPCSWNVQGMYWRIRKAVANQNRKCTVAKLNFCQLSRRWMGELSFNNMSKQAFYPSMISQAFSFKLFFWQLRYLEFEWKCQFFVFISESRM